jgi:hypothetical protein
MFEEVKDEAGERAAICFKTVRAAGFKAHVVTVKSFVGHSFSRIVRYSESIRP